MPKFAANLTMMFNEVEFLQRFDAAAEAGFTGVEYLFPYEYDKHQLAERLERRGLTQVLHNLPAGDWDAGDRGIACLSDRTGEFQDGVGKAIDYAGSLGCEQVNCLAGIAPGGADPDKLRRTLVANLKFAAAELGRRGVRLLVEPINTRDIPGFFLNNTAQARAIIAEVGSENLRLQYDIYHMQIMEGDLKRTMEENLDIIGHMQLADNPGRHEPGTGEIHYPFLFDSIDAMGYGGWIGCEYKPLTTTLAGLDWVSARLSAVRGPA
jgi:hydroxypyruvate isomerase